MPNRDHAQSGTTGVHLLAELGGCDARALSDAEFVKKAMHDAARKANATVLSGYFHPFSPAGVSGFLCLAESHISVHTWPQSRYAAADIFTCGSRAAPRAAIEALAAALQAETVLITELTRGVPLPGGAFGCAMAPPKAHAAAASLNLPGQLSR